MKSMRIVKVIAGASAVAVLASGCATNPDGSYEIKRTAIGALGGAALGAGVGALVGGSTHRGRNAAIGGLTGAVVGGGIGNYMDRQAAALRLKSSGMETRSMSRCRRASCSIPARTS